METAHASQNKETPSNDSKTLITLVFYDFYSKTRARKSRKFSIIFFFYLQTKQKDFLDLIFAELVSLSQTIMAYKKVLQDRPQQFPFILIGNYRTTFRRLHGKVSLRVSDLSIFSCTEQQKQRKIFHACNFN